MPLELGELIPEQDAMVRQRDIPRQRHLTPADQAHFRHGLVGGAKRQGSLQGRAPAGKAGYAVNFGRLNGLGQRHVQQEGGESAREHQRARPWRPQRQMMADQDSVAGSSPSPRRLGSWQPLIPMHRPLRCSALWESRLVLPPVLPFQPFSFQATSTNSLPGGRLKQVRPRSAWCNPPRY